MLESSADRDPLERLAEEFVTRYRSGQRPALTEYCGRHPELAEQIRELFPALVEMEQLKPVTTDRTGDFIPTIEPADPVRVGEFRILRAVGRGGMGVVYEAVQESLGRHVALKLLPAEALADPRRLERFRREAKAAARLHHTNIVPVFGTGEADGRHFYAMQFIDGHPLDAVIEEVRRLKDKSAAARPERAVSGVAEALLTGAFVQSAPPAQTPLPGPIASSSAVSSPALSGSLSDGGRHYWEAVARIGAQAADALAYSHSQGIQHRDIKPANLLLDLRGTLWVTDFGLAKATDADDLTHAGDVVGTLRYLAPERFDGKGDERADLYALGLTLYELLTLKPAFTADTRAKLVEQVVAASPPRPRTVNPAVPRDLETVVLKATARDPALRYASAAEMAEDLQRYLQDLPIRARRASSAEQAWRWCRRNPAVASLLTALLLVFATGAAVASWFAVRADAERDRAENREKEANEERERVRSEQERTSRFLYDSQINLAASALADERIPRLLQLLDETTPKAGEPDLRGWEWHYMNNLNRPPVRHEFTIPWEGRKPRGYYPAPVSPDGRWILVQKQVGEGEVFEVWDVRGGRRVATVPRSGSLPLPLTDSSTGRSRYTRPVLSADGQYLAVITSPVPKLIGGPTRGSEPEKLEPSTFQLWRLDTSETLPGPADVPSNAGGFVYGPGAAWVAWIERKGQLFPGPGRMPPPDPNGMEIIAARWDRETGTVSRKRFRSHAGWEAQTLLAADGATAICLPNDSSLMMLRNRGPNEPEDQIESWDLNANPPRQRWPAIAITLRRLQSPADMSRSIQISPGHTFLALFNNQEDLIVYGLSDGKPLWQAQAKEWNPAHGNHLMGVSDDGRRVQLSSPSVVTILERAGSGKEATTHRLCFRDRVSRERPELGQPDGWGSNWSPDGKTWIKLERQDSGLLVREIDVSRDPGLVRSFPGQEVTMEGVGEVTDRIGGWKRLVVRNAGGVEIGTTVDAPPGKTILSAHLAANERRLLVDFLEPIDDKMNGPPEGTMYHYTWALYEVAPGAGIRQIDAGKGMATNEKVSPPWFVVRHFDEPAQTGFGIHAMAIHHLSTGKLLRRVGDSAGPSEPETIFAGFSPTGDRYAVMSRPAQPQQTPPANGEGFGGPPLSQKSAPMTLHLLDTVTGTPLWDAAMGESEALTFSNVNVVFSPDGRRVCATIGTFDITISIWVGSAADGTTERIIQPFGPRGDPRPSGRFRGVGPMFIPQLGFVSDGRLFFLASTGLSRSGTLLMG